MFYPSSIPRYNRFRFRAEPVNTADVVTLAVSMPVEFRQYFIGAFSVLLDVNAWLAANGLTEEDMADIANNEVLFVNFCEAVADCINTDVGVQQALTSYLTRFGGLQPDSNTPLSEAPSDSLLRGGCTLDQVYGQCVAIEDYIHSVGEDLVEEVVAASNDLRALGRILSFIPLLGDLPVINDLNPLISWLETNGIAAYGAGYDTSIRQSNICALFNLACTDCDLTVSDVVSFYASQSAPSYLLSNPVHTLFSLLIGTLTDEAFVFGVKALVVSALAVGSSVGQMSNLSSLSAIASSGNPDSDWQIFCDPCAPPCTQWDFLLSDYGMGSVPGHANFLGTWIYNQGIRFVQSGSNCTAWGSWTVPITTITSFRIQAYVSNVRVGSARNVRFFNGNAVVADFPIPFQGAGNIDYSESGLSLSNVDRIDLYLGNGNVSNCTDSFLTYFEFCK